MIKSHSLHKSNIIFVFKDQPIVPPENHELVGLYAGDAAKGVQLVDDPMMRMKILDVPQRGLQIAWEARRLRIDDLRSAEPEESILIDEAYMIYAALCESRKVPLEAFGFNIEVYYQTSDVIRINDFFNGVTSSPMSLGDSLMDFGWQWTVAEKNGKGLHGYFIKVTAPLEFIVHHNAHMSARELPSKDELKSAFSSIYEATHSLAAGLKL